MVEQGSSGAAPTAANASSAATPGGHLVGTVVDGRYQIEALLGEGGMGLVYRATHTTLGKQLAVKVLRAEVSRSEEIVARFRQEAQSASAIGNQHIIDISDFGTLPDGSTYFVMEFLGGCSLTEALEAERFDTLRAITIALQLCSALGAAHAAGIVHRDMKPDNVQLIERGGSKDFVKVLDFGIAKVGGSTSKLTQAGQVFGTPHYMSPEQCAGTNVDHRTDIYALGVMLYEMVVGHVPFDADTLMGILTKHMYEAPIPPRQVEPGAEIPEGMQQIIMRCLEKDADRRYQHMDEFAADLRAVAEGHMPAATALSLPGTVASPATGNFRLSSAETDEVVSQVPGVSSGSGRTIALVLTAVLLIGGGVAASLMGGEGDTTDGASASPLAEVTPEPPPTEAPEPAEEADPSAEPEPEPEPVQVEVTVSSDPTGAEVYREGQLVGTTPYAMVRPEDDEEVEIELRLEGHRTRSVVVSAITGEQLVLKLSKERKVKPRKTSPKPKPKPATPTPTPTRPPRTQPEVLDPWG